MKRIHSNHINLFQKVLLLLATLVVFPLSPACAEEAEQKFDVEAGHIIRLIARGDLKNFLRYSWSEGILVVRREMDREAMHKETQPLNEPLLPKMKHGYGAGFVLGKQTAIVRKEVQINYEKSDLTKADFKRIFKQFQFFTSESFRSFPAGVEMSLNLQRAGDYSFVGPAVEGKMASNYWWRCYFVKQHGAWRVWKMEVEYTH